MSRKVIFKTYNQDQLSFLPPSYDDLVPENHPVGIVNTIVDNVDISALEKSYKEWTIKTSLQCTSIYQ
jgi:transposase